MMICNKHCTNHLRIVADDLYGIYGLYLHKNYNVNALNYTQCYIACLLILLLLFPTHYSVSALWCFATNRQKLPYIDTFVTLKVDLFNKKPKSECGCCHPQQNMKKNKGQQPQHSLQQHQTLCIVVGSRIFCYLYIRLT